MRGPRHAAVLEFFQWTEVPNLGAALAVVDAAGRAECGVLVDMLHFARSASTAEQCRGVPASRFPFVHICDAPAGTAWTREELFHAGRVERLPPGEGGIDIKAILANLPAGVPMSLEVPMRPWPRRKARRRWHSVSGRPPTACSRPPAWSRPLSRPMTEPLTCDHPGDRLRRRRTVRRCYRSVPRPQGHRGGKGAGARRHHRLVRRLDVGAAEPGGAAGRHRRGPEAPRAYLRDVLGNNYDEAKVAAFLHAAPRMVAFYEQHTALKFEGGLKIPDTYGNAPGAGTGGRSVIAAPYDGRELGPLMNRLRHPMRETTFMGMTIQAGPDLAAFMNVTRSVKAAAHVARRFTRHLTDLAIHKRGMQLRNGLALSGGCCAPP